MKIEMEMSNRRMRRMGSNHKISVSLLWNLVVFLALFLIASAGIATAADNGICGDVTGDEDINMGDVARLLYYVSYPGEYAISSAWAADVNGDESINMGDVARLLYYVSYPGEYELFCGAPPEIGCVAAHDGTVYKCGDMVVQSCTFNGDMSCPAGHGLEIGEDGIVIDGDGYCIDGVSPGDSYRAGIYNYLYDNVVIKNLEVKNFWDGIRFKGYYVDDWDYDSVVNDTIDNCEVHDNGNPEEGSTHGIELMPYVYHSTITNCTIYNNTGFVGGGCEDGGMGIRLHTSCCYNNITNNTIYGNHLSGIISKMMCKHNYVAYNDVYENGHVYDGNYFGGGIRLECKKTDYWIVEYNNITGNLGPGIFVRGNSNIIRYNNESGSKNAGNKAAGAAVSVGYGMYFIGDNNNITANEFCENEGEDIRDDGSGNFGDENTCDTTEKYDDEGTTGCTYLCSAITAAFSADQTKGTAPRTVNFTDESQIAEGEIVSWKWDFGDGNTSTEQNATHTYYTTEPYSYYGVSLNVTTSEGDSATETKAEYIKVWKPDAAPDADFSASPRKMAISSMTVEFTDLSIGEVESWFWDFGDGATSTDKNPTHEYTTGVYTVNLTVTGPGGSSRDTKTDYIVVNQPDPVPAQTDVHFFASSRTGSPPLEVAFTDMSRSEGDIDSWLWDFGDGNVSDARNPTHTYSSAGTYTVSLEVTAGDSKAKETKTDYIKP